MQKNIFRENEIKLTEIMEALDSLNSKIESMVDEELKRLNGLKEKPLTIDEGKAAFEEYVPLNIIFNTYRSINNNIIEWRIINGMARVLYKELTKCSDEAKRQNVIYEKFGEDLDRLNESIHRKENENATR